MKIKNQSQDLALQGGRLIFIHGVSLLAIFKLALAKCNFVI